MHSVAAVFLVISLHGPQHADCHDPFVVEVLDGNKVGIPNANVTISTVQYEIDGRERLVDRITRTTNNSGETPPCNIKKTARKILVSVEADNAKPRSFYENLPLNKPKLQCELDERDTRSIQMYAWRFDPCCRRYILVPVACCCQQQRIVRQPDRSLVIAATDR